MEFVCRKSVWAGKDCRDETYALLNQGVFAEVIPSG